MSPKKNLDYKDVVGKLMSEENISIVHATHYKTASFDLESRTLYLPEFANISENVYDLLIGHEVSHALHTPKQGWHDSTEDRGANFKTFLNVVEDARIEKMIQNKFPGLKSSFKRGYKELYDMDLFGIREKSDKEKQDMLLIDRLNIRFKLGEIESGMRFKDEERKYIEEMSNLKTWDDVVTLAEKLFEYCKDEVDKKQEGDDTIKSEGKSKDDSEDGSGSDQDSGKESEDSQGEENDSDGDEDDSSEKSDKEQNQNPNPTNKSGEESKNLPESITDKNFRDNEGKLVNEENATSKIHFSSEVPVIDMEGYVYTDSKEVLKQVHKIMKRGSKVDLRDLRSDNFRKK